MTTTLTRMQEAIGASESRTDDAPPHTEWILRASHKESGVSGELTIRFDTAGRFLRSFDSPLGTTQAFDGKRGRRTDLTGLPGSLDLSGLDHAKMEIWTLTGVWLRNRSLLDVSEAEEQASTSEIALNVTIPNSPFKGTLIVDRDTARPVRLETSGVAGRVVREFSDYQNFAGVHVPTKVRQTISDIVESETTVTSVEPVSAESAGNRGTARVPSDETAYTIESPATASTDTHFATSEQTVPMHFAPTGHILIKPTINGESTTAFIFDTGAGQCAVQVNPPESLGLRQVGAGPISTIFGAQEMPIYAGRDLRVGPLTVSDPIFASMDFAPFEPHFGEPIGGVVGYDVLRRAVVAFDIDDTLLTLSDPRSYELPKGGEWSPLRFQDAHPIIPGSVEGKPGLFRLDLGASGGPHGNLVLHTPAVKAHGFLDDRQTESGQLGAQSVAIGKISSLAFGGMTFGEKDVAFSTEEHGLFSDPYTAGNIGIELLRGRIVVFDYTNERIAFLAK